MNRSMAGAHSERAAQCAPSSFARDGKEHAISVSGAAFVADPAGALFWADEKLLVVADLHLEKGSAFAARGVLLPPYDTASTLARLSRLVERYCPRLMIALGDSFHDGGGAARMDDGARHALGVLQHGRDWFWIAGNHDPGPADGIGGRFADTLAVGQFTFRHEPSATFCEGEIAGHLHPRARVAQRGHVVSRRCFAGDGRRLIMPAFGAYAGGLNVRDRAIASLFAPSALTAHMLGKSRVYAVAATQCLPD